MANISRSYRYACKHISWHAIHLVTFTCIWYCCLLYGTFAYASENTIPEADPDNSIPEETVPLEPITILPGDCLQELFGKYSTNGRVPPGDFQQLLENVGLGKVVSHPDLTDPSMHVTDSNMPKGNDQTSGLESARPNQGMANTISAPENEDQTTDIPSTFSKPLTQEAKPQNMSASSVTDGFSHVTNSSFIHGKHTDHHQNNYHITQCLSAEAVLGIFDDGTSAGLTEDQFLQVCPILLQQLDSHACIRLNLNGDQQSGIADKTRCTMSGHDAEDPTEPSVVSIPHVWGYAFAAVTLISMASIVCILVVPCMQRFPIIYSRLLSFLVAMAVGTLSGDAVMHLMPHAFGFHGHKEEALLAGTSISGCVGDVTTVGDISGRLSSTPGVVKTDESDNMANNVVIKGLVVLMGIFSFFIIEQLMQMCRNCRQQKKHKTGSNGSNYTQLKPGESVGAKLCDHDQASERLSIVADPVAAAQLDSLISSDKSQPTKASVVYKCHDRRDSQTSNNSQHVTICVHSDAQIHITPNTSHNAIDKCGDHAGGEHKHEHNDFYQNSHDGYYEDHHHHHQGHVEKTAEGEHGHGHHGHSHGLPPVSGGIATLAWIIVMGDGLHNFCDGLVVGAAFADSLAGGLSTAIAVMCHEVPHELGDFAVLLKAGMSIKQALAFQGVSSILAYIGMAIGMAMGNISMLSLWIFALAAGMFLYIALADLFPEMVETTLTTTDSKGCHLLLQVLGVMSGVGLMLTIGLLEDDLMAALTSQEEV